MGKFCLFNFDLVWLFGFVVQNSRTFRVICTIGCFGDVRGHAAHLQLLGVVSTITCNLWLKVGNMITWQQVPITGPSGLEILYLSAIAFDKTRFKIKDQSQTTQNHSQQHKIVYIVSGVTIFYEMCYDNDKNSNWKAVESG